MASFEEVSNHSLEKKMAEQMERISNFLAIRVRIISFCAENP